MKLALIEQIFQGKFYISYHCHTCLSECFVYCFELIKKREEKKDCIRGSWSLKPFKSKVLLSIKY